MKIQQNSHDPYIINVKEMLYDHECDGITTSLESQLDLSDEYENIAMNQIRKLYTNNAYKIKWFANICYQICFIV